MNEEDRLYFLTVQKNEIEAKLNTGFLKCYYIWQWISFFCVSYRLFTVILVFNSDPVTLLWICGCLYCMCESLCAALAYRNKNLKQASLAHTLMIIHIALLMLLFIAVLVMMVAYNPSSVDTNTNYKSALALMLVYILMCLCWHIGINVNGAADVKSILLKYEGNNYSNDYSYA